MAPRTPKSPSEEPKASPAKPPKAANAQKPPKPGKSTALPKAEKPAPAAVLSKGTPLRLKGLIDTVAQASGGKKAAVKPVVEATLAALAAALHAGTSLSLPPLGKVRVAKVAGEVTTLKLRKIGDQKSDAKALADDGEDD